ncbi:MAG: hypothetical protein WBL50_08270 [Candidatus Acidiferrum sp.]
MTTATRNVALIAAGAILFCVGVVRRWDVAQPRAPGRITLDKAEETAQVKIARALSAAPDDVAKSAKVVDKDASGKVIVLREGTNDFTCMPGNPKVVGQPPMCMDAASRQWFADFSAHSQSRRMPRRGLLTCWPERRNAATPTLRQDKQGDYRRTALDDHVAVRSKGHRFANDAQADGCVHHVVWVTLRTFARDGTTVTMSGG